MRRHVNRRTRGSALFTNLHRLKHRINRIIRTWQHDSLMEDQSRPQASSPTYMFTDVACSLRDLSAIQRVHRTSVYSVTRPSWVQTWSLTFRWHVIYRPVEAASLFKPQSKYSPHLHRDCGEKSDAIGWAAADITQCWLKISLFTWLWYMITIITYVKLFVTNRLCWWLINHLRGYL